MGSYQDYIEEDGTLDWPRKPASLRDYPYCPECGDYLVAWLSVEDCVKVCHGPGYHTIGHNGQLWLTGVIDFYLELEAAKNAAVKMGVPKEETELIGTSVLR